MEVYMGGRGSKSGLPRKSAWEEYNKGVLDKVVTADGIEVISSIHSVDRLIEREIKAVDIKDALVNPVSVTEVKYDDKNRPSKKYIGGKATVAVNPETRKIVTVHGTHRKLLRKLEREKKK